MRMVSKTNNHLHQTKLLILMSPAQVESLLSQATLFLSIKSVQVADVFSRGVSHWMQSARFCTFKVSMKTVWSTIEF